MLNVDKPKIYENVTDCSAVEKTNDGETMRFHSRDDSKEIMIWKQEYFSGRFLSSKRTNSSLITQHSLFAACHLVVYLFLPPPPRTWRWQTGGQLKTWATTILVAMDPLHRPRVFGYARWRKDWVKFSCKLAHIHRAWVETVTSKRDVFLNHPGWTTPPTNVFIIVRSW